MFRKAVDLQWLFQIAFTRLHIEAKTLDFFQFISKSERNYTIITEVVII